MTNFIQRTDSAETGKDYIIDTPAAQSDFLQFIPAVVTGVSNSGESLIAANNPGTSNSITVKKGIWVDSLGLRGSDKTKFKPLLRGISDSIVIGDDVLITTVNKQPYYLGPINIRNSPSDTKNSNITGDIDAGAKKSKVTMDQKEGKSLTYPYTHKQARMVKDFNVELDDPDESIGRIKHPKTSNSILSDIHTDLTFEGRHGNSIRIGSRNINPHIFISNGRDPSQNKETILDGSIFVLTERGTLAQHFPSRYIKLDDVEYAFKLADESIETPVEYIKNTFGAPLGRGMTIDGESDPDVDDTIYGFDTTQTLLSSDRITFNARKDNMFISAFKQIHLGAGNGLTFSTSNNTIFNSAERFDINAPEVRIGSQDDTLTEPLALGDTLVSLLERLCEEINNMNTAIDMITVPTTQGTSGTPMNGSQFTSTITKAVDKIKSDLPKLLSQFNRTT